MNDVRAPALPHHQWLELEAVNALKRNDAMAALEYADRRCRISPPPLAHSHVLRAEALFRAGDQRGAVSAIEQALQLAPDDIAANRRRLAWAESSAKTAAAANLIDTTRDSETLRRAIETLRAEGRRDFASWVVLEDVIDGWALWEGDGPAAMTIDDGACCDKIDLHGAPCADFPEMGAWRRFRVPRPRSSRRQSIAITINGRTIRSHSALSPAPVKRGSSSPRNEERGAAGPTVIVPIYSDFEATSACLECLLDELDRSPEMRAALVNDASPESRIVDLLNGLAEHPRIRLLTNQCNLGFVGAVNRALDEIADGDIVLLNADTLTPPGFVARLAEAARSASDIGLVMPLSNNGDLASFPSPYLASPMPTRAAIEAIDRVASQTHRGLVVDIPNGIGLCLYITRPCINAVPGLCEDFERGYLEDVDLSLRARARGFRTVCAPSVYVGHAGSKSFGAEKRGLVVRNASIVHSRYPDYSLEFAAFAAADPLREARQAIQRHMPLHLSRARLLVAGAGVVGEVARARARALSHGQSILLLQAHSRADGWRVVLTSPCENDALPAEFDLCSPSQGVALIALLRAISLDRIELLDPISVPLHLVELLQELDAPYDVVVADAGLLGREGASRLFAGGRSFLGPKIPDNPANEAWVERWRAILAGADEIVAIDRRARAFAASVLPQRIASGVTGSGESAERGAARYAAGDPSRLGLVPIRKCASEQRFLREIAAALFKTRPDLRLIVVGATLDDAALMRCPNLHVTGPVEAEELETVATTYALDRLFVCVTQPLFGHPLLNAAFSGARPLAYVDWTNGAVAPRRDDLALDPSLPLGALIEGLNGWVTHRDHLGAKRQRVRN